MFILLPLKRSSKQQPLSITEKWRGKKVEKDKLILGGKIYHYERKVSLSEAQREDQDRKIQESEMKIQASTVLHEDQKQ